MSAGCTRVELWVDVGSQPITGRVTVGVQAPQPFAGWIELASAIESARGSAGGGRGVESSGSVGGGRGVAASGSAPVDE